MKKIALITFHGSHNFGSVLQAYATQQYLEKEGAECDIINYRMQTQKQFYSLFQIKYGLMRFVRNVLLFPIVCARIKRAKKFEQFIMDELKITDKEYSSLAEIKSKTWDEYTTFISGGDQLWNPWVPEISKADFSERLPYFLDFVHDRKKISFATSIGIASEEDLSKMQKQIREYTFLSTREIGAKSIIEKVANKKVHLVLDPVFLLEKEAWGELIHREQIIKEPYVLLYTLQGVRTGKRWSKNLEMFAKTNRLKIVAISPFFPIISLNIHSITDAGPKDFLNLLANAECVCTDSFHGTAFSIIFEKPFFSANKGIADKDYRKNDLLYRLGLESRMLSRIEDISKKKEYELDYTSIREKIKKEKEETFNYLKKVLSDNESY